MTLLEIRDQVKIDGDILADSNFPNLRLNNMINQAQRFVQAELNGLGMKKWEASATLTLGSAQQFGGIEAKYADLPTGMLEAPNMIDYLYVDDGGQIAGVSKEVNKSDFVALVKNSFLIPTIEDSIFMRENNQIVIFPTTITGVTAHYYKIIIELSVDGTESDMPEEFIEYVIRRVVSQVESIQGKLNEAMAKETDLKNDIQTAYNKFVGKMATAQPTEVLSS